MLLRTYQREACDAAWSHLCGQAGNPVVVLPTGAGKSLVIAELCRAAVQDFSGRVMVLAHRKELLSQNADKIRALLPFPVGMYSAGLNRRDTDADVICAGIQSVFRKPEAFGARHLVVIDEVHLVGDEGMYQTFLGKLREINPKLRMVGLTATPFRTGEGALCRPDALFQKICYEAKIPGLIENGYLSPVVNQPAGKIDTSGLHVRGGEFIAGEVENLFDRHTAVACAEIAEKAHGRRSVLVFCAGVAHAHNVATCLHTITGEHVGVVTGDTPPMERAETLARFRAQQLRILCNVDVLTTGFDAPCIDAIAILRATCSPGLFAQICGRGFRLSPGKANCQILDFGENIKRHGPLDAIDFGKRMAIGTAGDAPTKTCPNCDEPCHASARECQSCGWRFPDREPNHGDAADEESQILAVPKDWIVEEVRLSRHRKKKADADTPDTLRADYLCRPVGGGQIESVSEWVCIDHEGWAGRNAAKWWSVRSKADPVADDKGSFIDSCINLWKRGALAAPRKITTLREGRFWKVTKAELDPVPDTWLDEVPEEVFVEEPF